MNTHPVTLTVSHLSKVLPNGKVLLDDISFRVKTGEFVGILGHSGAGKTLTIRSINGLMQPSSGDIRLLRPSGEELILSQLSGKALRKARQQVGVIFQGFHLVKRLTALENVLVGRLGSIPPLRSILRGFSEEEAQQAMRLLDQMGIQELAFRKTGSLSGGEMQRVAIARALFQRPLLMLADEPIASLDPSNAVGVMQLLRPLKARMPVLGVFHQPDMTARFCTRVIALKAGKVIYDGDPQLSPEQLFEIYGERFRELLKHPAP